MRLTYKEVAAHLGLSALDGDIALTAAITDSREAAPGALFVCIPGSRVDGHDFVPAAVALGAFVGDNHTVEGCTGLTQALKADLYRHRSPALV